LESNFKSKIYKETLDFIILTVTSAEGESTC